MSQKQEEKSWTLYPIGKETAEQAKARESETRARERRDLITHLANLFKFTYDDDTGEVEVPQSAALQSEYGERKI